MKITESIHSLKIPFQIKVNPETVIDRFVNVYIIFSDKIYLIDTGVLEGRDQIYGYIREQGRSPEEIAKVFITHSHPDHIGAVKLVKEDTGCVVSAHKNGQKWIEDTALQFRERPVPGFNELVAGSCKIDTFLRDDDIISLGNDSTMEVLYTPGHSEDSISLYFPEEKILISGDLITLPGDLPIYTNYRNLVKSLNEIKELNFEILLSSWLEGKKGKEEIDKSITYLSQLDNIVKQIAKEVGTEDKMLFCGRIIEKLGLPKIAQNPLVATSFISHIEREVN